MPSRKVYFRNGYFYHLYNRSIDGQDIFKDKRDIKRYFWTIGFYRYKNAPLRLSHFLNLKLEDRNDILGLLKKKNELVIEILNYAIMPNHYHLLVKQVMNGGISWFISNIQNSYARYFNTKNKRIGHLFQSNFKAVLIESEEQLIHMSRYIELNPLSSFLLKDFQELFIYEGSSLREYISHKEGICQKKYIISHFKTIKNYLNFLKNQVDYQRRLEKIKHLILESDLIK